MRFVLAGDLDEDRSRLKRELKKRGAEVGSVVTADTDALFAGRYAKLSKTDKAEQLGVPILGIAELRRLLESGSLQHAVEAPDQAPDDRTPFPRLSTAPRDGTFVSHHPGTDQIRATGARVAGLADGEWTYFHPNGQTSELIVFERGLRHGPAVGYYDDGTKKYEGAYARGHQHGPWDYWYASGAWKQRYIYDEQGKTHGPYVWDLEDGSPRARGAFWHGLRDGDWEWHAEPKHERMIRGYHQGNHHGHEAAWYLGGQLAYSHHWDMGQRVGEWVEHHPDGSPKLKCTYDSGHLVGEHRAWDESGTETLTVYVAGLRQSIRDDEELHAKVLAKVDKGRSEYQKRAAISDAVEYSESGPYLLHLWRSGKLELEAMPELWEGLRHKGLTTAEVMTFLAKVKQPALEKAYSEHLPFWPRELDALVCHAYASDAGAFADWRSLPEPAKVGVAFVMARAGEERALWEDVLAPHLDDLVKRHIRQYGLGERIWWWVDGELREMQLYERPTDGQHRIPLPRFYELVAFFGDRKKWSKAVLRETMKHARKTKRVPWESARDGLALASRDQLLELLHESGYEAFVETVFLAVRDDDADFLEDLAISAERGRGKLVALCAAEKRLDAGEPISDALLEAIMLDVGTYSSQSLERPIRQLPFEDIKHVPAYVDTLIDFGNIGRGFTNATLLFDVFERLPVAQQRAKVESVLDSQYGKTAAVPFLRYFDDEAMWKRGVDAVAKAEDQSERASVGLAMLPSAALPLLIDAHANANKKMKGVFHRAILGMMARMVDTGQLWDPEHDVLIRADVPMERWQYEYGRLFLAKIIHRLPVERAEPVLLRMLDGRRLAGFGRAFRFIGSHPTPQVIERAIRGLLELEAELGDKQDIEEGLRSLDDKRELIKWLLRNGAGSSLKRAFETAIGHREWPKLQEELKNEGVEEPKELDGIDKLIESVKKATTGSKARIHALRPKDEAPEDGSLNVRYGAPPGVGADRWPMFEEQPMTHLFTIDLQSVGLQGTFGARALSVFCFSPDYNEAWQPHTGQTAIVLSNADQLGASVTLPDDLEIEDPSTFEVVPIDVPFNVFYERSDLHDAVYGLGARVGGEPIWLQDDESPGSRFIMQFDESFIGINLGDCGVMYVFEDTAFWQCH